MTLQQQLLLALALAALLISIATLYEVYRARQRLKEAQDIREVLRHEWTCPYTETCNFKLQTNDEETFTLLRDSHILTHH